MLLKPSEEPTSPSCYRDAAVGPSVHVHVHLWASSFHSSKTVKRDNYVNGRLRHRETASDGSWRTETNTGAARISLIVDVEAQLV